MTVLILKKTTSYWTKTLHEYSHNIIVTHVVKDIQLFHIPKCKSLPQIRGHIHAALIWGAIKQLHHSKSTRIHRQECIFRSDLFYKNIQKVCTELSKFLYQVLFSGREEIRDNVCIHKKSLLGWIDVFMME